MRPGRLPAGMVRWSSMELAAPGDDAADDLERDAVDAVAKNLHGDEDRVAERDSIFSQGYLQRSVGRAHFVFRVETFGRVLDVGRRSTALIGPLRNSDSSHASRM